MGLPSPRALSAWLAKPRVVLVTLVLGTAFAAARFFRMVDRHAVDILFRDQWSIRGPFFEGRGLWEAIRFQHGPHRQGLGAVFIALVDWASAMNVRTEAFATAACILVSALFALACKRRLSERYQAVDVAIPFLFMGYALFELFAVAPNPAHGALPLLLVTLAAWLLAAPTPNWWWLGIVGVLASHTGFGSYLSILLCGLSMIEAAKTHRLRPLFATVVISASLVLFFSGYVFEPAIGCFVFPHPHPLQYLGFVGVYLIRPFATFRTEGLVPALATGVGVLAMVASGALLVRYLRAPAQQRLWPVVCLLVGASMAFGVGSALGRVCAGLEGALVSRYVAYALPLWFGVYLLAQRVRYLPVVLLVLFFAKDLEPTRNEGIARAYSQPKRLWRACYLRTHDWRTCDKETNFAIHFVDEHLDASFELMRERRLNVYRD